MPQDKIQFQPGMSLSALGERFGTEAQCEAALQRARWPARFVCPECGESAHWTFTADERKYWQCAHCRAQLTVRSGTLVSCLHAAADQVVTGDLPGHAEQEQALRALAQAASGRVLPHRLAGLAQAA